MAYKIRSKKAQRAAAEAITASDAAKNFGRLADRVREHGATYVITRHGRAIAQIGPVENEQPKTLKNLIAAIESMPKLDEEVLRYIEKGRAIYNKPEVPRNRWER